MSAPTTISYQVRDELGVVQSMLLYVAYDALLETVVSLQASGAIFGGVLDAITDGVIESFTISIPFQPDPSWKTAPVTGAVVGEGALFNFDQANVPYPQEVVVPAYKESLLVAGKINLAPGSPTFIFTEAIRTGSTTVFPNSKYNNDLTKLRNAKRIFRKHRKLAQATLVEG